MAAGGPLLVLAGFLVLPLVWSVPEALITAELATAFPENSGYVAWVTAAFGPFWGFQVGPPGAGGGREGRTGMETGPLRAWLPLLAPRANPRRPPRARRRASGAGCRA